MEWWENFLDIVQKLPGWIWVAATGAVAVILFIAAVVNGRHLSKVKRAVRNMKKEIRNGRANGVAQRAADKILEPERSVLVRCRENGESAAVAFSAMAAEKMAKGMILPFCFGVVTLVLGMVFAYFAGLSSETWRTISWLASVVGFVLTFAVGSPVHAHAAHALARLGFYADRDNGTLIGTESRLSVLPPQEKDSADQAVFSPIAAKEVQESAVGIGFDDGVEVAFDDGTAGVDTENRNGGNKPDTYGDLYIDDDITLTKDEGDIEPQKSVSRIEREAETQEPKQSVGTEETETSEPVFSASVESNPTAAVETPDDGENAERVAVQVPVAEIVREEVAYAEQTPAHPSLDGRTMEEMIASARVEAAQGDAAKYGFRDLALKTAEDSGDEPSADDFVEEAHDAPVEASDRETDEDFGEREDVTAFDDEEREQLAAELRERAAEAKAQALEERRIEEQKQHEDAERIREEARRAEEENQREEEARFASSPSIDESRLTPEERRRLDHKRRAEEARQRDSERARTEKARRAALHASISDGESAPAPAPENIPTPAPVPESEKMPTPAPAPAPEKMPATARYKDSAAEGGDDSLAESEVDRICREVDELIASGGTAQERTALAIKLQESRAKYHSRDEDKRLHDAVSKFLTAIKK